MFWFEFLAFLPQGSFTSERRTANERRAAQHNTTDCYRMGFLCCIAVCKGIQKTTPKCLCFLKCRNDNISKHKRLTDTLTNIYICQHWPPSLPPPPPPDSASPAPPTPRDTERWECGKVIFRTQAESLPEFDALAPDQHSTFEPVRPWGCLCPWWQFFFFFQTFSCGSNRNRTSLQTQLHVPSFLFLIYLWQYRGSGK